MKFTPPKILHKSPLTMTVPLMSTSLILLIFSLILPKLLHPTLWKNMLLIISFQMVNRGKSQKFIISFAEARSSCKALCLGIGRLASALNTGYQIGAKGGSCSPNLIGDVSQKSR